VEPAELVGLCHVRAVQHCASELPNVLGEFATGDRHAELPVEQLISGRGWCRMDLAREALGEGVADGGVVTEVDGGICEVAGPPADDIIGVGGEDEVEHVAGVNEGMRMREAKACRRPM